MHVRRTIRGRHGLAEDLRPVSDVETKGKSLAGRWCKGGQVAGSLPRKQPGTGTRQGQGEVWSPSLHPKVPGTQFASRGRGLGIRQSMGWTKVCVKPHGSGIWVLKGERQNLYASQKP